MVDLRQYQHLPSVQMLKRIIRDWWGLELAFSDAAGFVLDHAEGKIIPSQNEMCRASLSSTDGARRCSESVAVVRDQLRSGASSEAVVHDCHLGFDIVAAPIRLDDELAGFLFTGGSLRAAPGDADYERLVSSLAEVAPEAASELRGRAATLPVLDERERGRLRYLVELGARAVMDAHRELRGAPRPDVAASTQFGNIVGSAPAVQRVFEMLDKVVRSESTVLIHGESGTGKELVARAVHERGPRAKKPFIVQNCSAFNDNLLESALFGHTRGAFTGAVKDTEGLFKAADGGTFFLDEIGDMSPALQVKLLRVLQEGTFTPVGATRPVRVDVRVIAATHKDLTRLVERGGFREDLYYRINVIKLTMPALRERMEDLPVLAEHFLRKHHRREGDPPRLAEDTLAAFASYAWPGNIRELENEIERVLVLGGELPVLGPELLSPRIRDARVAASVPAAPAAVWAPVGTLKDATEALESEMIRQGLARTRWNKNQLAKELGISRSSLVQKCVYYGLDRKEDR